jgi:3'-phosphoadenosine 5'-phosphosulfate (PAPS) 3'-phosphatase
MIDALRSKDGVPVLGVLGCPNLAWSFVEDDTLDAGQEMMPKGCLFVAVQGAGSYQLPLWDDGSHDDFLPTKLSVTPSDGSSRTLQQSRMCLGVERYSDARGLSDRMARYIHRPANEPGNLEQDSPHAIRVDSQVKYGLVARGDGEFYVRLPKIGYQEWIWDHAAGSVVLAEAGGVLTDTEGNPINFGLGRRLSASIKGILGSNGGLFHQALLDAYRHADDELLASEKEVVP